ncbi:uncharacterized protein LOC122291085 [Carya illinoinensis]|uniref:uncharacterized protein LOC122291085 n=1 Tax=Carya illinoinensis TaxID=32201 RepID=UPI001C7244D8|nr:uncharacterized protein LOC122291085 [Carya illinoinensis]
MEVFREALVKNELFDLGWVGDKYTWSNRHEENSFIKERLDRVVVNVGWSDLFKNAEVEVMQARSSDHKPIMLTVIEEARCKRKRRWLFKYEAKWSLEEEGGAVVQEAWKRVATDSNKFKVIEKKLQWCSRALSRWDSRRKQEAAEELKSINERLKWEQQNEGPHNVTIIKELQKKFGLIMEQEDLKWRQRAKQVWHQMGDRNTKYFHACATQRRKRNWIKKISDEEGRELIAQEDISDAFTRYYAGIFQSSMPTDECIEDCLKSVEPKVTLSMNEELVKVLLLKR